MGKLDDKVALVTGGGRGIGAGITECFLAEGARVVVAQRKTPTGSIAGRVDFVQTELSDSTSIEQLVANVVSSHGGIDVLVNNAGIMFEKHVTEMSEAEWDEMLSVNLKAPFLLTKHVVPVMEQRGGGTIINIGSIEGLGAHPGHTAYCASKGGIHGMTKALAVELGRSGIRVNAIAPGWIQTDLVREYVSGIADQETLNRDLMDLHPVRRLGEPVDIGHMAVFLASEDSRFMTGQIVVVDGGRLAQLPSVPQLRT